MVHILTVGVKRLDAGLWYQMVPCGPVHRRRQIPGLGYLTRGARFVNWSMFHSLLIPTVGMLRTSALSQSRNWAHALWDFAMVHIPTVGVKRLVAGRWYQIVARGLAGS